MRLNITERRDAQRQRDRHTDTAVSVQSGGWLNTSTDRNPSTMALEDSTHRETGIFDRRQRIGHGCQVDPQLQPDSVMTGLMSR